MHIVCEPKKKNMGFLTRLKAGSMLPERTTTTGDSLPVKHIKAFHIIKAIDTIIPAKQKKNQEINKKKGEISVASEINKYF